MVIKASASAEIRQLVAALGGDDEVRREAAIARLSILGERATEKLVEAYDRGRPAMKVAILRALEAVGDRRAIGIARRAIGEESDVAMAALSALRALLNTPHEATAAEALDNLVSVTLDPHAERRVRLAAFDALRDVPGNVRDRVADALRSDPDAGLQTRAVEAPREAAAAEAVWQNALEGRLPEAASDLRDLLQARAAAAPLGVLQKLIDALRHKEGPLTGPARDEWLATRGALHRALALRGSRVAVYDLRETLTDARRPLPVSFLAALHVVGDASCLDGIAAAYSQAPAAEVHWRYQLASAFRAISTRERITKRHLAIKRLGAKWPKAIAELTAPASRSGPEARASRVHENRRAPAHPRGGRQ